MSFQSHLSKHDLYAVGQFYPAGSSRVVIYKSKKVFLKTIKNCKMELNMDILISLKQVRELVVKVKIICFACKNHPLTSNVSSYKNRSIDLLCKLID